MLVDGLMYDTFFPFYARPPPRNHYQIKRALKSDKDVLTALNAKIIMMPLVPLCIVYYFSRALPSIILP